MDIYELELEHLRTGKNKMDIAIDLLRSFVLGTTTEREKQLAELFIDRNDDLCDYCLRYTINCQCWNDE